MSRHFLQPVGISAAEQMSDADPASTGIVAMADGGLRHYVAPGSLHDQLGYDHVPLTQARTEASAATSDQRNWASYGAANEPVNGNKTGT